MLEPAGETIDGVDTELGRFFADALKDVEGIGTVAIRFFPQPAENAEGCGVIVYLFELGSDRAARTSQEQTFQFVLRYWVTTWAVDPAKAHRMLGELVFAAMANPRYDIDLSPLPASVWSALRLPPCPGFVVQTRLKRVLAKKAVPRVRHTVVEMSGVTALHGVALGPGDVPLAGAVIEFPEVGRSERADEQGRFTVGGLPVGSTDTRVRVTAKGQVVSLTIERRPQSDGPLIIRCPLKGV